MNRMRERALARKLGEIPRSTSPERAASVSPPKRPISTNASPSPSGTLVAKDYLNDPARKRILSRRQDRAPVTEHQEMPSSDPPQESITPNSKAAPLDHSHFAVNKSPASYSNKTASTSVSDNRPANQNSSPPEGRKSPINPNAVPRDDVGIVQASTQDYLERRRAINQQPEILNADNSQARLVASERGIETRNKIRQEMDDKQRAATKIQVGRRSRVESPVVAVEESQKEVQSSVPVREDVPPINTKEQSDSTPRSNTDAIVSKYKNHPVRPLETPRPEVVATTRVENLKRLSTLKSDADTADLVECACLLGKHAAEVGSLNDLVTLGGLDRLVQLAQNPREHVRQIAVWGLANVASGKPGVSACMQRDVLKIMLPVGYFSNATIKRECARFLRNVAEHDPELLFYTGGTVPLLTLATTCDHPDAQSFAIDALRFLSFNAAARQYLIDNGALNALTALSRSNYAEVQRRAGALLTLLVVIDRPEIFNAVKGNDLILLPSSMVGGTTSTHDIITAPMRGVFGNIQSITNQVATLRSQMALVHIGLGFEKLSQIYKNYRRGAVAASFSEWRLIIESKAIASEVEHLQDEKKSLLEQIRLLEVAVYDTQNMLDIQKDQVERMITGSGSSAGGNDDVAQRLQRRIDSLLEENEEQRQLFESSKLELIQALTVAEQELMKYKSSSPLTPRGQDLRVKINTLESDMALLVEDVEEKERLLSLKDSKINQLESELTRKNRSMLQKDSDLRRVSSSIAVSGSDVEKKRIQELQESLNEKEKEITFLNQMLATDQAKIKNLVSDREKTVAPPAVGTNVPTVAVSSPKKKKFMGIF